MSLSLPAPRLSSPLEVEACPVCGLPPVVRLPHARLFQCGAALNEARERQPCSGPISDAVLAGLRRQCLTGGHFRSAAALRRSLRDKRCPPAEPEAPLCDALAALIEASAGPARELLEGVRVHIDDDRWP